MIIYDAESALKSQILEDNVVACYGQAIPYLPEISQAQHYDETPETPDLYFTKSILVSTTVNKNWDAFLPVPTWRARKTPVDKPTNIGHDMDNRVGHITNVWAIGLEGEEIEDEREEDHLPDFFHLCNTAVIYKVWRSPEASARIVELIRKIELGEMYVSMEALFDNFNYLLIKDGEQKFIERRPETAYLTKHLRQYGGTGEWNGYQLARALDEITFSGKGYVERPANPSSIIFSDINKIVGVYTKCTENIQLTEPDMSENLEKRIAELTVANEELRKQLADTQTQEMAREISELTESQKVMATEFAQLKDAHTCLLKQYEQVAEEKKVLEAELATIKAAQIHTARIQKFIDLGFTKTEAETKVNELKALDDATFGFVASHIAPRNVETLADEEVDNEVEAELEAEEQVPAGGSVESEEVDELAEARLALANHFEQILVKGKK